VGERGTMVRVCGLSACSRERQGRRMLGLRGISGVVVKVRGPVE